MSIARRFFVAAIVLACGVGYWVANPSWGQDAKAAKPKPGADDVQLRTFMRQKLEACHQILEGIATDNGPLVKSGADTLTELSNAEKWRVSNDVMYRQFSDEFQRTAKKLSAAADKGNFDDVTLKWIDATLKCVECHKFVRGMRIAQK